MPLFNLRGVAQSSNLASHLFGIVMQDFSHISCNSFIVLTVHLLAQKELNTIVALNSISLPYLFIIFKTKTLDKNSSLDVLR